MKNRKLIMFSMVMIIALVFVAGCGTNDKPAQTPPPAQPPAQQQDAHSGHNMPGGDPLPMMKEIDVKLTVLMKQIKSGQSMDAQTTAGQVAGLVDKVVPHLSDSVLKDKFQKAAYDLRDTLTSGKADPSVIDAKVMALHEVMGPAEKNLAAGKHE